MWLKPHPSNSSSAELPKYAQDAILDFADGGTQDQAETQWAIGPETTYRDETLTTAAGSSTAEADPFELILEREITCPACLGRHRAHTKDAHCRLGPPPAAISLTAEWLPLDEDRFNVPNGAGAASDSPDDADARYYSCPACRGLKRRHRRDHTCRKGPGAAAVRMCDAPPPSCPRARGRPERARYETRHPQGFGEVIGPHSRGRHSARPRRTTTRPTTPTPRPWST